MKKFIIKVFSFIVAFSILFILPGLLIDPFNVFHWKNIRNNGVEPNKNYIKTKYVLSEPVKFNSFLFGSSRAGAIHVEKIKNAKVYNFNTSGGLPEEHLATLNTFIDNGIIPCKIYLSLDSLSYTMNPKGYNSNPLRCSYQYLKENPFAFFDLYMNPRMLIDSLSIIKQGNNIEGYSVFYDYGWWCDYNDYRSLGKLKDESPVIGGDDFFDETLSAIRDTVDICKKNNIQLVVFTNPMFKSTYLASLDQNYYQFLKCLAQITDYYNFSGLNDITVNPNNYLDSSHFNAEVGDMIIDVIENGDNKDELLSQGFGYYVTSDNINYLLEILESTSSQ